MKITGHGALFGSNSNSEGYFRNISRYSVDAVEVDVRMKNGILYLAHWPWFNPNKALPLARAFDYAKSKNIRVNIDMKDFGLVGEICALAEQMNAQNNLYFTGRIMPSDIPNFTCGDTYVNEEFYARECGNPTKNNLAKIKTFLDSFSCDRIKGINTGYRKVTESFVAEAKRLGLGLSLYTVNSQKGLERVIGWDVDNVTTFRPDRALAILESKRNSK